jgi:hypothetical protein
VNGNNGVNVRAWSALAVAIGLFALTGCGGTNTTSSKTTDPDGGEAGKE